MQQKRYPGKRIATEIVPEQTWWDAEDYHQQCACLGRALECHCSSCEHCMRAACLAKRCNMRLRTSVDKAAWAWLVCRYLVNNPGGYCNHFERW